MKELVQSAYLNVPSESADIRFAQKIACVLLAAAVWLWPHVEGPIQEFWPNWVAYICLFLLIYLLPRDRVKAMQLIAIAWVGAAFINALIGLAQYFGLKDALSPGIYAVNIGVAVGNLRQTNHLATFLSIGLLGVVWLNEVQFFSRRIAAFMAVVIVAGIAATASRVGAINLFLVALAFFCFGSHSKRITTKVICICFLIYLGASFLLPELLKLFHGLQGRSIYSRLVEPVSACHGRLVLWSNVLDLIAGSPWVGRTDLSFQHYMHDYGELRFCEKLGNSHNLILQFAVSYGIPVAFLLLLVGSYFLLKKNPWVSADTGAKLVWVCVLLILVHSLLEYPLWYGNFQVAFILCFWYLYARSSVVAIASQKRSMVSSMVMHIFGVVLLFFLLYISFDYLRVSQLYLQPDRRMNFFAGDLLKQANKTFLFKRELIYSQVRVSEVTAKSAPHLYLAALEAVRYSPDPEVIEKLIESAIILKNFEASDFHAKRYRQVYPADFDKWNAQRRDLISTR